MKLALGTVQFGTNYGITNSQGQVQIAEVQRILDFAQKNNIKTLDTAPNYGDSEETLGKIGVKNWQVITKTISIKKGVDKVIKATHQSLKKLNKKTIDGLLIHDINDTKNKQFDTLFKRLNALKKQGLVKKIGFSTYTPEQIDFLLANFDFDLIQVPINLFDQRLIVEGKLKKIKNKNIEIHARSIFLQGLLLTKPKHIYFSKWQVHFDHYFNTLNTKKIHPLSACINFALSITELDKIIVGVTSTQELAGIITASKQNINLNYLPFTIAEQNLINPTLWKNNLYYDHKNLYYR